MIPEYLQHIAREIRVKGDRSTCALVCPCGNDRFHAFHNKLTDLEQAEYDRYFDEYQRIFQGSYASMCTREPDGTLRHWKLVVPGIRIEVFPPETPPFATVVSWKVRCSTCGEEYLIFDNRIHGYDGVFCSDGKACDYSPQYVQRNFRDKTPRRIEITTENDPTLAQFRENTGIECDFASYSNAFGWISVYAVDDAGKKTKLLDWETA